MSDRHVVELTDDEVRLLYQILKVTARSGDALGRAKVFAPIFSKVALLHQKIGRLRNGKGRS